MIHMCIVVTCLHAQHYMQASKEVGERMMKAAEGPIVGLIGGGEGRRRLASVPGKQRSRLPRGSM